METVFHLTAGDPDDWQHAFGNVENLLADEQVQADPVLVVAGNAAYAVVESSPVADAVRDLLTQGVDIAACSNALGTRGLGPDQLVAGVDLVESGVGEVTRRQADGAAYVSVP